MCAPVGGGLRFRDSVTGGVRYAQTTGYLLGPRCGPRSMRTQSRRERRSLRAQSGKGHRSTHTIRLKPLVQHLHQMHDI
ncbi:hypothetical protein EC9_51230 [Rosistilla ulvae]|uniref:Uncharacterized protein n=1 Tax=Rosistilla ulvae TaxID=1930277 RepID=A0A517M7R7_9BACT|nr:hypothetical protein EC9_51230 [Rosistilla ulvae]